MKVITNAEFISLTKDKSRRLQAHAKKNYEANPSGSLSLEDLDAIRTACHFAGDKASVKWLDSLRVLATSGKLDQLRSGNETWEDHVAYVHRLYAQKSIPFDIDDPVIMKDTGKRGKVIDYIPDSNEFIVVTSPFQWDKYPAKELQKIATKA